MRFRLFSIAAGTHSLYEALNQLGYKTHHMVEAKNRGDIALWAKIGDGDLSLLDQALQGYNATTDFPSVCHWKELIRRNPEAKIVLTVRDAESWFVCLFVCVL